MKNDESLKTSLDSIKDKAKERTVKTQSFDIDLETLVKKIKKGIYKLDPDYQRRRRWDRVNSSKLIESLILNIPVPTVYISQDIDPDSAAADVSSEDARYTVIDGQQRLTAIKSFFENEFELTGLSVLGELNGIAYSDLPPFLKRRLEDRSIRCLQVDSTTDSQVKYDIFERLNTGSVKLESQELRNCVYRGEFNDLIKKLAENKQFLKALNINVEDLTNEKRYQKMEDVELVLRFFALRDYKNFKSDFKSFMDIAQDGYNKSFTPKNSVKWSDEFNGVLSYIIKNFGEYPFSKWKLEESGDLKVSSYFNAAVYDAVMIGTFLGNPKLNKTISYDDVKGLFKDAGFFDAVDVSTNRPQAIEYRIEKLASLYR